MFLPGASGAARLRAVAVLHETGLATASHLRLLHVRHDKFLSSFTGGPGGATFRALKVCRDGCPRELRRAELARADATAAVRRSGPGPRLPGHTLDEVTSGP
ncbi:hypothetical protein Aau02nite_48850 [Amorphoplanes auranticolor]|uniref:Uncharacterized protein n=1 Tax=Actinoplanes auranticolor TaxID=47988 RepID=A0A919SG13_9ACTN|nr:hypothetical protein Aau02nite_48850 [Actinoplanes auranticolor]